MCRLSHTPWTIAIPHTNCCEVNSGGGTQNLPFRMHAVQILTTTHAPYLVGIARTCAISLRYPVNMRHICGVCCMCMTYLRGMPRTSLVWRLIVRVSRGVHGRAELGVLPARYHLIVRHTLEVRRMFTPHLPGITISRVAPRRYNA